MIDECCLSNKADHECLGIHNECLCLNKLFILQKGPFLYFCTESKTKHFSYKVSGHTHTHLTVELLLKWPYIEHKFSLYVLWCPYIAKQRVYLISLYIYNDSSRFTVYNN